MANNSSIEWTDATWNPTTGCTRASAGCDNCYAFTMTKRLAAMGQDKYQGLAGKGHFNGVLKTWEDELEKPLRWRKPRNVFVNSMSDLFHDGVPFEFVYKVFAVMALCGQHTFQVLTKRPERMAECLLDNSTSDRIYQEMEAIASAEGIADFLFDELPLANVWLGTSVEDQRQFDIRVPYLCNTPAAVRFLSVEPLLGPIQTRFLHLIQWVIVGGESGHGARPMHPNWAKYVRDQCNLASVPFFFKQWGEWAPLEVCAKPAAPWTPCGVDRTHIFQDEDRETVFRIGKKAAGRLLDGREWSEYPNQLAATN